MDACTRRWHPFGSFQLGVLVQAGGGGGGFAWPFFLCPPFAFFLLALSTLRARHPARSLLGWLSRTGFLDGGIVLERCDVPRQASACGFSGHPGGQRSMGEGGT